MINRERVRILFPIAWPVLINGLSMNLMSLVDMAMVGSLGYISLAAVGAGGFLLGMIFPLMAGVTPAVRAFSAHRLGQGDPKVVALPLNASLMVTLMLGPPLTALAFFVIPYCVPILLKDPIVIYETTLYLKPLVLGITLVGLNGAFGGFWGGLGRTKINLVISLVTQLVNIGLNYILIFGKFGAPPLGALGAAYGSVISVIVANILYFVLTLRWARVMGFLKGAPTWKLIKGMLRLSIPSTIQQIFTGLSAMVFFWIVAQGGAVDVAALTILFRLRDLLMLPAKSLGAASSALAGQALGRKDPEDAARWGWDSLRLGMILLTVLGVLVALFNKPILGVFTPDAGTIEVAGWPMIIMGLNAAIGPGATMILTANLMGVGDNKRVMNISLIMQWCFTLPALWITGPVLGFGLTSIWLVQAVIGQIRALAFARLWRVGEWKKIEL